MLMCINLCVYTCVYERSMWRFTGKKKVIQKIMLHFLKSFERFKRGESDIEVYRVITNREKKPLPLRSVRDS